MHHRHVNPEKFARDCYEYGTLSGIHAWKAHMNQLSGCAGCAEALVKFYEFGSFEEMAALKEPGRELTRRLERRMTDPLLKMLKSFSELGQMNRVHRDRRFHSVAVAKALLRRSRARWGSEPRAAFMDSRLALIAMGELRPSDRELPRGGKREFEALSWAHQGNALRISCDLHNAELCFGMAQRKLKPKHGDPIVRATVLQLKSSLLRAQRSFRWAMAAIDEAIRLFQREEEERRQAEALLVKAKLHFDCDNYTSAAVELAKATPLLASRGESRMAFIATNLKLSILSRLGRNNQAEALLQEARGLAREFGSPADSVRVNWCAANIAAGLGDTSRAESLFQEVRSGFAELDCPYDVALASLELAQLYAEQERHEEVEQLAREMVPIFQSNEIHREALAATQLFADAVRVEEERGLITKLSAYLANARHDPAFRFSL